MKITLIRFVSQEQCSKFFYFFKILIFWVVMGVNGQRMVQNDKKTCLWCFMSQNHASYDCHLWYACVKLYHLQVFNFHFFKILIFWVAGDGGGGGGKGGKTCPKKKKIRCAPYLRNHISYDFHL